MTGGNGTALSIGMLAAFASAGGGIYLLAKKRARQRGWLMLAVAVVLLANVLIWTL